MHYLPYPRSSLQDPEVSKMAAGSICGELQCDSSGEADSGLRPVRADQSGIQRGIWYRQHEVYAERSADT